MRAECDCLWSQCKDEIWRWSLVHLNDLVSVAADREKSGGAVAEIGRWRAANVKHKPQKYRRVTSGTKYVCFIIEPAVLDQAQDCQDS
jgi:hypothetical protein